MVSIPNITLNDGSPFPVLGLGTYGLRGEDGIASLVAGIETGYRLLDTAVNYENEAEVGDAIRRSGVDRDELIVTTKIPGRSHGFEEALASTNESLIVLGLDRIDLSLIHWPNPRVDKYVDTWRAMIELRERGSLRSIGVSNFTEPMLTRLIDETGVAPAVNQVELHPYFPQTALRAFHAQHGIRTESWSPLAQRSELLPSRCSETSPRCTPRSPPRSCCAGTSTRAARRSRNRATPTVSRRTPMSSTSSSTPTRSRPSPPWRRGGSGAPTPTPTRSSRSSAGA